MAESTANLAIRNLMTFVNRFVCEGVICWATAAEQQEMQYMYNDLYNFPGVVGMIDCSYIQIEKPSERGYYYYNRKDHFFVILQATCREDLFFTDVYTGWPGKVHDARVFRNSPYF